MIEVARNLPSLFPSSVLSDPAKLEGVLVEISNEDGNTVAAEGAFPDRLGTCWIGVRLDSCPADVFGESNNE
jgi:hypothetical protein